MDFRFHCPIPFFFFFLFLRGVEHYNFCLFYRQISCADSFIMVLMAVRTWREGLGCLSSWILWKSDKSLPIPHSQRERAGSVNKHLHHCDRIMFCFCLVFLFFYRTCPEDSCSWVLFFCFFCKQVDGELTRDMNRKLGMERVQRQTSYFWSLFETRLRCKLSGNLNFSLWLKFSVAMQLPSCRLSDLFVSRLICA